MLLGGSVEEVGKRGSDGFERGHGHLEDVPSSDKDGPRLELLPEPEAMRGRLRELEGLAAIEAALARDLILEELIALLLLLLLSLARLQRLVVFAAFVAPLLRPFS